MQAGIILFLLALSAPAGPPGGRGTMIVRMKWLAAGLLLLPALATAEDFKIAYASLKGIFVMDSRGHSVTRLAEDPGSLLGAHAWSPDGKRILFFVYRKQDAALEYKYNLPFHFPMYAMDADGKNQKRLINAPVLPDAKWSPDGKSILFTSSYEGDSRHRAVYVYEIASGRQTRLTELGFNGEASWSPDSRKVVFASGSRPREIYVVDRDGSNLKQLTNLGMIATNPVWSPDGRSIAFAAEGWFMMDADGANKRRVNPHGHPSSLAWSPDGKHVLVTGQGSGYVWNTDGTTTRPLPTHGGRVIDSAFSPDGRKVIYRAHEGPKDEIYVVNVDGSDWKTINANVGERATFAVSPLISE